MVKVDYKEFQAILNRYCPDHPMTEAEAVEAFHNLVGFVSLLMQINDRVGLVPFENKNQTEK